MINKVTLIGRLGKDPEIRHNQEGDPIANLTVATTEKWKNKAGEWQELTEWHRVVVFSSGLAKYIKEYATKGALLYIEGKLKTRKWQDNSGNDRFTTEIVLSGYDAKFNILSGAQKKEEAQEPSIDDDLSDSIPF